MFIELPPFSASPSDPNSADEALFDLHTLTLEPVRGEAAGRLRTIARASREPHARLAVAPVEFELTYTATSTLR